MLDQDKILNFLKVNGPTYPSKVAKNIKTNILLASAHLSDLTRQGKVKISDLKIGASPLYFLTGQEDQLYQFAQGNINPKDYQALEMLHQKKVLRENNLEVLNKVALRGLKDFAVPLHVTIGNNKEVFWKWHLLSDEETNKIISAILFGEAKVREEKPVSEPNAPGQTVLTPVSSPENKIVVEEPVLNDTPAIPEKTSEKETDIVENKKEEEEDKSDKDKKIKEKENKVNKEEKEEKESKKNKDIKSSKEIKDEEIKEMIGSEKENKDIKLEEEEENIEKEKKETELEKVLKNELNEEKENKNNSVNNLKLSKDKIKQKPLLQKIKERISRKKINDKFLP